MEGHNHVINEMHNISAEGGKAMLSRAMHGTRRTEGLFSSYRE